MTSSYSININIKELNKKVERINIGNGTLSVSVYCVVKALTLRLVHIKTNDNLTHRTDGQSSK